MTANRTAHAFARLRPTPDEPDAELLRRYAAARDAGAFEAIVRRHAALVFAACRRVTGHAHDAEDAFQAVFLVLARNAGSVREPHLLASWLYGVAVRVGRKARARSPQRREESRATVPEPLTPPPGDWADVGPVIDEELAGLPAWYRQAVLLCDVQQQSRTEAAARLGVPEGTLSSRLAKGRKLLAGRLARRGVTLALPALASIATAAVPELLIRQTLETVAVGAAGGFVGPSISELAREGITVVRKLLFLSGGVIAATALGVGLAGDPVKPPAADPQPLTAKPAAAIADAPKTEARVGPPRQRGIVNVAQLLQSVRWSADGKRLLLTGSYPTPFPAQFDVPSYAVKVIPVAPEGLQPPAGAAWSPVRGDIIGPDSADPLGVIVHVKEEGGINVRNELVRYQLPSDGKGGVKTISRVDLADDVLSSAQLPPDGRQAVMIAVDEATGMAEIREIDPATGRTTRVVFRTPEDYWAMSGNGAAIVTVVHNRGEPTAEHPGRGATVREVHVWDAAANKQRCAWKVTNAAEVVSVVPSHDGKALAIVDLGVTILDTLTGKEVRRYEPAAGRSTSGVYLSHDGRLTVISEVRLPTPQPGAAGAAGPGGGPPGAMLGYGDTPPVRRTPQFVTVYDNATGKPIKKWETGNGVELAFAPDRATLAVLEWPPSTPARGSAPGMPGGGGIPGGSDEAIARLGLWDFGK
ncbi:RNA polymerase sigma factor [Limnoglobus roseus]|uniref:RNA polymerase sigma-H factor n=1 Tax=Limnoglobus roseus TaxID=2598579 RepID=A0A5C1AAE2_9BACT|nr:RNA polymerase sigma factor [Limnoglobus roseus]QEL14084.1 RNA polymerase sigma-H factor [Limnoglobus roseus]